MRARSMFYKPHDCFIYIKLCIPNAYGIAPVLNTIEYRRHLEAMPSKGPHT